MKVKTYLNKRSFKATNLGQLLAELGKKLDGQLDFEQGTFNSKVEGNIKKVSKSSSVSFQANEFQHIENLEKTEEQLRSLLAQVQAKKKVSIELRDKMISTVEEVIGHQKVQPLTQVRSGVSSDQQTLKGESLVKGGPKQSVKDVSQKHETDSEIYKDTKGLQFQNLYDIGEEIKEAYKNANSLEPSVTAKNLTDIGSRIMKIGEKFVASEKNLDASINKIVKEVISPHIDKLNVDSSDLQSLKNEVKGLNESMSTRLDLMRSALQFSVEEHKSRLSQAKDSEKLSQIEKIQNDLAISNYKTAPAKSASPSQHQNIQ